MKFALVALVLNITPVAMAVTPPIGIVIHGGAGTISRENMTPAQEQAYHAMLSHAVNQGYAILARGGSSLDAVTAAVLVLEDSP
jgi:L-asparaginase / beta-aspartyl-peptidase